MIISVICNRFSSCLRAWCLWSVITVLPCGVACATDVDAVERRLGISVSEGELTLKQAAVMLEALRSMTADGEHGAKHQLDKISRKLKAAVKSGDLTEAEAKAKWADLEKAAIGKRLKAAVQQGDMTVPEAWLKWRLLNKHDGESRGAGIERHYRELGVTDRTVSGTRDHLREKGLTNDQVDETLGGILRVIHEMRSEGEEYELDPRLRDHFKDEIDLSDEQIELVEGLARRILYSLTESD